MERTLKVLFLVNGNIAHPYGIRARGLSFCFKQIQYKIAYRRFKYSCFFYFLYQVLVFNPALVYVVNVSFDGIFAGIAGKLLLRKRLIVDSGDVNYELFKKMGKPHFLCLLAKIIEETAFKLSDCIIVRGRFHADYLKKRGYPLIYQIPDGVEPQIFTPEASNFKKELNLAEYFVIGMLGSMVWIKNRNICYGTEIIDALKLLKGYPVKGLIIGSGSGKIFLQKRVKKYDLEKRVIFIDYIPYLDLPKYINTMDVCISIQTNDLNGWVRVTGKLPLYMSCARYVISTDVGEAHYLLPEEMLLPYKGDADIDYHKKLAEAIKPLLDNRDLMIMGDKNREIAINNFSYAKLSGGLERLLLSILKKPSRLCPE